MRIPKRLKHIYEIAERHKWNLAGIGLALLTWGITLSQMDMMFFSCITWEEASKKLWIPELGITYLVAWEMFWILSLLSIVLMGIACIDWRK